MSDQKKSNLKTAGVAVTGGIVGGVVSNMMNAGLAWGMTENGEETSELETLQFETENGTVTLQDADANGIYDAVVMEKTANVVTEATTTAPVSENTYDEMSFSEAFGSAREEVGAGGVFAWNGNVYGTYYKEEWDGMDSEEKDDYWASVNQAEQENEYLASVYEVESMEGSSGLGGEAEIITTSLEADAFGAEPVEIDLNEDGINESIIVDTNEDGVHDAIVSDTNNDGKPDLILADTNNDGEVDSYLRDTDHDGKVDDAGTIPTEEPHIVSNEGLESDYDNNADVSDMV